MSSKLKRVENVFAAAGLRGKVFDKSHRRMKRLFAVSALLISLCLAGCDSPQHTIDKLRTEIVEFQAKPDADKQIEIDKNFIKLEDQVTKLSAKGDAKAEAYRRQLVSLRSDYQAAKMAKAMEDAKNAIQGLGEAAKEGVKGIGDFFRGGNTNSSQ